VRCRCTTTPQWSTAFRVGTFTSTLRVPRPRAYGHGMSPDDHLDAHRAAGRMVTADGVATFVREEGPQDAPAVLCLHGVPSSSYLYRKVLPALAGRGCRGIAYDLPGLGFADRPPDLDYSWSGLADWSGALVEELGLDGVHLVLHDIGGPIGLLLAAHLGGRVRSITLLNTIVDPTTFTPPMVMRPFTVPAVARLWLRATLPPAFVALLRWQGVADRSVPADELLAYRRQLLAGDGGAAFLRIMQSFEHSEAVGRRMRRGLHEADRRQVVWGELDPSLPIGTHGEQARDAAGVDVVHRLPGKHFLQEDCAPELADLVADLVHRVG
jgi:haloalkane dehalogenase